ncbi:B3 domain-containing protein Os03g0120900-like isoform X2 [Lolium perenne]|uniref:B3 domain-containing protein Os03g0120900-like isoform X2 n=1 Tax=Lolium perenne TaxID=4522 RepID=UPI003A9A3E02
MEEEEGRPRFFKEIPRDFLSHIAEVGFRGSGISAASSVKLTLKRSERKTWTVELEKVDRCVFLTTGWPQFVVDNSLRGYEFLLFTYDKNMHFTVSVFGWNACEKAVPSSGSGAQATEMDKFASGKRGHSGHEVTEAANNPTRSHSLVTVADQSNTEIPPFQMITRGNGHSSSQSFVDLHLHQVDGSKDELKTYLLLKVPMNDDRAVAIAEVMRRLHLDKVTIDLFCATLCLHKWNSDAAAEDFDVCRGKPQIQNQFLKQKLVLQFDFIKRQLRCFFPPEDDCSTQIRDSKKSSLEEPNLSNQPLQFDLAAVKSRLVGDRELCDFSYKQKRRTGKWRSLQTSETPRRSPRLARLNNSRGSTETGLKERPGVVESSVAGTIDRVENRAAQASLPYEKPDSVSEVDCQHIVGSLSRDFKRLKSTRGVVGLSEKPEHNQGENKEKIDQGNKGETLQEQIDRNAVETYDSLMERGCIDTSPATKSEVSSLRLNELYLAWKPSVHANPHEEILLHIQRDNFTRTISHVQGIIRSRPSDLLCAAIIEAVVQKELLKWDPCLEDVDAQRIVIALLEHAKKIKEIINFNMDSRKEEFSTKLHDQLKWQLKELENVYTSTEVDYKKVTLDGSIAVSTLQEQKKKLHALQGEIKDSRQSMMIEDEMQKLVHEVAEQESLVQRSLMERVRVKTVLKSYEQILVEAKERLALSELGLIDVETLVKVEMDNMRKELEISKRSLLNIVFK